MNIKLIINKINNSIAKRTSIKNNKKSYKYWLEKGYDNTPIISFIIQSHNKGAEVKYIVSKLRDVQNSEIIVIDDGSDIKHTVEISKYLNKANDFIIRANDLYENVMYDRAIRIANGKYIALLQDDDDFENLLWVENAISYFSKYKNMVILGGRDGYDTKFDDDKQIAYGIPYQEKIESKFRFVHNINRAPMWINKNLYDEKLKHIDFNFAPFQLDDCELCMRAWDCNMSVGWYNAGFKSLSAGGMRIWNSTFMEEQNKKNAPQLYNLYKHKKDKIDKLVECANKNI